MPRVVLLCVALLCMVLPGDMPARAREAQARYVFLFIGDGMGVNQVATAAYLRGEMEGEDRSEALSGLSFTGFSALGLMSTHSWDSPVTDSAAAITAMASGQKARNETLNLDPESGEALVPVSCLARDAGYAIGVITSASLDHATPAGFYASTDDRYDYAEIAQQGLDRRIMDFWAGGGFQRDEDALVEQALDMGYRVVDTPQDIRELQGGDEPVIALAPASTKAVPPYMAYEIDRLRAAQYGGEDISLRELVEAGIRVLSPQPFFLVCEAAKVDTACSTYDAVTAAYEVLALDDAVQAALEFAQEHPQDTLIVVLADHETGSLQITYGADYDGFAMQIASAARFEGILEELYEQGASWEQLLEQVEHYFGIAADQMSQEELSALGAAYAAGYAGQIAPLYQGIEPVVYQVMQMVGERVGVKVNTVSHSGQPVAVYAQGAGAELFQGVYDNTRVFQSLKAVMGLQ